MKARAAMQRSNAAISSQISSYRGKLATFRVTNLPVSKNAAIKGGNCSLLMEHISYKGTDLRGDSLHQTACPPDGLLGF
jgi:hypothetical protein